jgi:hypothetical protein
MCCLDHAMRAEPHWPDVFFKQVPEFIVAMATTSVAIVLIIWGCSLVLSSLRDKPSRPKAVCKFEQWLGVFMTLDGGLYLLLTLVTLRQETIDVWASGVFLTIGVAGLQAFRWWAQMKLPLGQDHRDSV